MPKPEPHFAPDPITLACLLAAFACGLGAWADLLAPMLLRTYGQPVQAVVVSVEAHPLPHGGHDDFVTYRFDDGRHPHEQRERVPMLAAYGMPRPGARVAVRYLTAWPSFSRLQGNESSHVAGWLLEAAVVFGVIGLANFRQWRYPTLTT